VKATEQCANVREKAKRHSDMVTVLSEDTDESYFEGLEELWVSRAYYSGPEITAPRIDIYDSTCSVIT
jgi:hypothetical protein